MKEISPLSILHARLKMVKCNSNERKKINNNCPIKNCIITSSHPPFDTRIFQKECRSLVDAGFDVTLIAPAEKGVSVVEGVKVIGFGKLISRWQRIINLFIISKMALQQKVDIYHIHEPELLLLLPLLKIFRHKSKFIYDVHENYRSAITSEEKHWLPRPMKGIIAPLLEKAEKFFSRRVDLVIAASSDIEANFTGCRATSIRNFVSMRIINDVINEKKEKEKDKIREIVYTGSMTRTRGIKEIVKSLELIDPEFSVGLTMSGKFHDPALQKEVEKLPGYNKVLLLGWVPKYEDMLRRVVNSDAAMICFHPDPNLDDAVERSNKLFEYMGLGLPIIVSNIPAWSEIVARHKCGLVVNPLDPRDIAEKLNYLFKHPDEARQMGINGREAVIQNYQWENEARKLVASYLRLSGEGAEH
jgi:glycosyltransferase involved in cell wall biosynthesis